MCHSLLHVCACMLVVLFVKLILIDIDMVRSLHLCFVSFPVISNANLAAMQVSDLEAHYLQFWIFVVKVMKSKNVRFVVVSISKESNNMTVE